MPFLLMGVWGFETNTNKQNDNTKTQITEKEALLNRADALFDQGNYKEIYNILSNHKVINNF